MGTSFSSLASSLRRDVDMVERYYATKEKNKARQRRRTQQDNMGTWFSSSASSSSSRRDMDMVEGHYARKQRDMDLFINPYKVSMQRHKNTRDKYDSSMPTFNVPSPASTLEINHARRQRDMDLFDQYKVSMQRHKNTRDKYDSSMPPLYVPSLELQESLFSSSPASTVEINHDRRQRDMDLFMNPYKVSMQRHKNTRDKYDSSMPPFYVPSPASTVEINHARRQRDMDLFDQYKVSMQRHKNTRDKYESSRKFDVSSNSSDEDDYYPPRRSFDVSSISSEESYAKEPPRRSFDVSSISSEESYAKEPPRRSFDVSSISSDESYAKEPPRRSFDVSSISSDESYAKEPPRRSFDVSSISSDESYAKEPPRRSFDVSSISSDESYAKELQESLYSSSPASTVEINYQPEINTEKESTTRIKELLAIWINPFKDIKPETRTKQQEQELETEIKPAKPSGGLCMICMEEKPSSEFFKGTITCTHSYCTECTIRYVTTKIEKNVASIKCPDMECTQLIELHTYRDLITNDMFERWDKRLRDTLILSWKQLECPFKDCSAMMVVDDEDEGENAKETECPSCHRLFCAQCKVKWHAGIGCKEFERGRSKGKKKVKSSDHEDTLLIKMAKRNKWRRCPSCQFYVEKVDGCMHIYCRCGLSFCYGCGLAVAAEGSHVCPKPKDRRKRFRRP